MTFVKGERKPGQGGHNRWGLKFLAAQKRHEEKMQRKALAKMSPDERLKVKLEQELEDTQFRADVIEEQVGKCGDAMAGIVDSLKEMAQKYGVMIENGCIVHMEVTSPAEAQHVHETFDSLKRRSNQYQAAFNQVLSERAGLANRILELQLDILKVKERIETAQMTVQ